MSLKIAFQPVLAQKEAQIICLIFSTISCGLCAIKPVKFCRLKLPLGCCEDQKGSFPGVGSNIFSSSLEHLALVAAGGIAGGDIAAPIYQQQICLALLFSSILIFLTKKKKRKKRNTRSIPSPFSSNASFLGVYLSVGDAVISHRPLLLAL